MSNSSDSGRLNPCQPDRSKIDADFAVLGADRSPIGHIAHNSKR